MKRAWILLFEEHTGWRLDISLDVGQDAIMCVISLVCGSW